MKAYRRLAVRARAVKVYRPLAVLALLAVAIRVALMITYSTAVFVYYNGDSLRYARINPLTGAHLGLFSDPSAPGGYPIFLRVVRDIWSALAFTIGIQHCLGVATGLLLYAALRRLGAPRGFALAPAVVVFFSGDQLFLEQALLTESLWAVLIAGGLYALVRGIRDGEIDARWLAVGGLLVGASTTVRSASGPLVLVVALWAALAVRAELIRRARAAMAVGLPAVAVICAYVGLANIAGSTDGYSDLEGFQLYGRVAQFADCTKFKPPGRTRLLCQTTPPARRPGPTFQLFASDVPLNQKAFNLQLPHDSALLGRFGQQAILHQPGAYLSAIFEEYGRMVGLGHGRVGDGANPREMRFGLPYAYGNPAGASTPTQIARLYRVDYSGVRAHALGGWAGAWSSYQGLARLHEGLVGILLVLAIVGVGLVTGRARAGAALFLAAAVALYVVPPLIALWDVRYGVLPGELLVVAASVGAWSLWERYGSGAGDRRGRKLAGVPLVRFLRDRHAQRPPSVSGTPIDHAGAENFIWSAARLVDRHRYSRLFAEGPAEPVVEALRGYRNPDGGFGHALEPDLRCPGSQPAPTLYALEILNEAGVKDGELGRDARAFLASIAEPDGGIPSVLPGFEQYPHAPWFQPGPGSVLTLGLAAALHAGGVTDDAWLDRATDWCWRSIETAEQPGGYWLKYACAFLDAVPDEQRARAAIASLNARVDTSAVVPVGGVEGEALRPLDLSPRPGSRSRGLFSQSQIEAHLDAVESGQQPDGGWMFDWLAWSPAQTIDWRGNVTLRALTWLRDNGRL